MKSQSERRSRLNDNAHPGLEFPRIEWETFQLKNSAVCLVVLLAIGCVEPSVEELKTIVSPSGEFAAVKVRKDIHVTVGLSTQLEIRKISGKEIDLNEKPCLLWSGYRMGIQSFAWTSPRSVQVRLEDSPHNRKQALLIKRSTCFGIQSEEVWIAAPSPPPVPIPIPEDARGWGRN